MKSASSPQDFRDFIQLLPEPLLLVGGDSVIHAANRAAAALLEAAPDQLAGQALDAVVATPGDQLQHYLDTCARSRQFVVGALDLKQNQTTAAKRRVRCEGAALRPWSQDAPALLLLRLNLRASAGDRFRLLNQKIEELAREVLERKRAEALVDGQREVLELIAHDAPLEVVLERLMRSAEAQSSAGMLCSILLLEPDGVHLRYGAAPSLPQEYNDAIDGLEIGPHTGSCGTAAYRAEPVIVTDIAADPLWEGYRELALAHGLRACWSTPVFSTHGMSEASREGGAPVLGTFAMYYRQPLAPGADDLELIQLVTRTAAVAIERQRAEEERIKLLESERQARLAAEQANRMKDEFLATVSHELRTPLNAVLGWAEILRLRQFDESTATHAIDTIVRNARAQAQIIEDLLDVSRIISGKLRLNVRRVDLPSIVEAALDAVRPAADAKGIRLQVVLDPGAGPVAGDPDRLQQIVWNLLSNAIRFTPRGGRVQVRLQRVNSHIEILVSDSGVGINPAFLPHIFERFRQEDSSSTRRYGGLGLGLALVRHLVDLHGGTVHADSAGEGHGATFTVTLPVMVLRDGEAKPAAGDVQDGAPESAAKPLSHMDQVLQGLRLLVVEDEPDARELLQTLLAGSGASVTAVASCKDALEALERSQQDGSRPHIIISDIGMPDEDGYDLIRQVRQRGVRIPAIALTAYSRSEDRMRALGAGFQMHIPKPVEPSELIASVSSLASWSVPEREPPAAQRL